MKIRSRKHNQPLQGVLAALFCSIMFTFFAGCATTEKAGNQEPNYLDRYAASCADGVIIPALGDIQLSDEFCAVMQQAAAAETEAEKKAAIFDLSRLTYIAAMNVAVTDLPDETRKSFVRAANLARAAIDELETEDNPRFAKFARFQIIEGEALIGNYLELDEEKRLRQLGEIEKLSFDNPVWELQRRYVMYLRATGNGVHTPFQEAETITKDAANQAQYSQEMEIFDIFIDLENKRDRFLFHRTDEAKTRYMEQIREIQDLPGKIEEPVLKAWMGAALVRAKADINGKQLRF